MKVKIILIDGEEIIKDFQEFNKMNLEQIRILTNNRAIREVLFLN